jgi:hypothetical protein
MVEGDILPPFSIVFSLLGLMLLSGEGAFSLS